MFKTESGAFIAKQRQLNQVTWHSRQYNCTVYLPSVKKMTSTFTYPSEFTPVSNYSMLLWFKDTFGFSYYEQLICE